jgi:hypothetical protein
MNCNYKQSTIYFRVRFNVNRLLAHVIVQNNGFHYIFIHVYNMYGVILIFFYYRIIVILGVHCDIYKSSYNYHS